MGVNRKPIINLQPRLSQQAMEEIAECYCSYICKGLSVGLDRCKDLFDNGGEEDFYDFVIDDFSHQKLINPEIKLNVTHAIFAERNRLSQIHDFDALISEIDKILLGNGIKNVPSLWSYDLAMRIGYSSEDTVEGRTLPESYVHTYRGAHKGAKKWFANKRIPVKIPIENFRNIFPVLEKTFPEKYFSIHIENMLCQCCGCISEGCKMPTRSSKYKLDKFHTFGGC